MNKIGYYNGNTAPLEELQIPALDRAVYFGDGVYDVAFIHNRKFVAIEDHLDRFINSCKLLKINIDKSKDELKEIFMSLVAKTPEEEKDFILYFQMSRGVAFRDHTFPENDKPSLFAYIVPKKIGDQKARVGLITQEDKRFYFCNIKTINLIPNVLAAEEAKRNGCIEAILHRGEIVTEGAHTATLIIKDGAVITHPLDCYVLPSITRKHIKEICSENSIPFIEREFTLDELRNADEILIASTTTVIKAASSLDGKPCGGKNPELLERLQKLYFQKFGLD